MLRPHMSVSLILLAALVLTGCANPATPAAAPKVRVVRVTATDAPAAPAPATLAPAKAVVVTATPPPAAHVPTSTPRAASPSARFVRNEAAGKCRWVVYIYLTDFAPNSVITVDSNFDETECATGKKVTGGHWTEPYGQKTDANGRLMVDYLHEATGRYLYVFTDEQGRQASVPFTTQPDEGPVPTSTLAATPRSALPTSAPTKEVERMAVVKSATLNLRSGPGQNYPVVGKAAQGDRLYPVARVGNCAWLQVGVPPDTDLVWVAGGAQYVTLNVPCETLMVQTSIPPTPLPPPTAVYRPSTGLLSRSGGFGSGVLRIKNGTDTDGVVILVTVAGTPVQAAYIRTGATFEMTQIADGSYRLYFTKGEGWDRKAQQFTSNVTRQKFANTLAFGGMAGGYEVTLYGVAGGNARTQNVPPGEFPGLP